MKTIFSSILIFFCTTSLAGDLPAPNKCIVDPELDSKKDKAKLTDLFKANSRIKKESLFQFVMKKEGQPKSCKITDGENVTHTFVFQDGSVYENIYSTGEMATDNTEVSFKKPMAKNEAEKILSQVAQKAVSDCKITWDKSCFKEAKKNELTQIQCFCPNTNFSVAIELDNLDRVHHLSVSFVD
jgi:hypothetical protein